MKKITKAELKKRNAEFNALPPLKKRVAVAKDVLLQLKTGRVIAMHNDYGSMGGLQVDANLQEFLVKNPDYQCECCAKGAAVLAKARLGNDVYGQPVNQPHAISSEIFGSDLADILEHLFEYWDFEEWQIPRQRIDALSEYRDSLPEDPADRMRAIYQNIITNRGHFVVGDYKY